MTRSTRPHNESRFSSFRIDPAGVLAKRDCEAVVGNRFCGLQIEQFRSLSDLRIEDLGPVNLITGMNNTGKTSVLEAIRILASNASLSTLSQILRLREEDVVEADDGFRLNEAEPAFPYSNLFQGYPEFSGEIPPIRIAGNHGDFPTSLMIEPCWLSELRTDEGVRKITVTAPRLFEGEDGMPGLRIKVNETERLLPLEYLRRGSSRSYRRPDAVEDRRFPCLYVGPGSGDRTAGLGLLWDRIALSDLEGHIVKALKIIDDNISAVSMVGGEGARSSRTAIVRSTRIPRPVPLKSFGDGVNRLFGIILSLVNSKDGCLLIDEFENGLHHTVQADAWRMIFQLATALNVQVFATTHSMDAVEAFQTAASETPAEGVLVRLARKGQTIVSTVFREAELAVVTRNQIEVR